MVYYNVADWKKEILMSGAKSVKGQILPSDREYLREPRTPPITEKDIESLRDYSVHYNTVDMLQRLWKRVKIIQSRDKAAVIEFYDPESLKEKAEDQPSGVNIDIENEEDVEKVVSGQGVRTGGAVDWVHDLTKWYYYKLNNLDLLFRYYFMPETIKKLRSKKSRYRIRALKIVQGKEKGGRHDYREAWTLDNVIVGLLDMLRPITTRKGHLTCL